MKMKILIVSYGKDAPGLEHCLRSIDKYASGFSGVTVVYPYRDMNALGPICKRHDVAVRMFQEIAGKGHLHQNAIKCHADVYCLGADWILHMDSDDIFVTPTRPESFFRDGKPILCYQSYETLKPKGNEVTAYVWKAPTERALGFATELEFMCAFPIIHHQSTYEGTRQWIAREHKCNFMDYVFNQKADFPYGFCEFDALGGYAHRFAHEKHTWQNVDTDGWAPLNWHLWHLWSHGGMDHVHPFFKMAQGEIIKLALKHGQEYEGRDPMPMLTEKAITP